MRLFSSVAAITISLLLFCFLISGCSFSRARYEPDTLRINLANEPPSLDWHVSSDSTSFDVVSNLMIGLTQYKNDLSCAPACAESWDVLDNGKRYVFHLRHDLKWSDGKELTSKDFKYAWQRILNPSTGAPYAFFLYDINNAREYNSGSVKDFSLVGVKCIDPYTLEVQLRKPASYFINLTAICPSYPQRQDIIEKYGNRWTEAGKMITNGPFILKDWIHEYKIELATNPFFFENTPRVKTLKMFMIPEQSTAFALYENDQLDFIDNRSFPTPDVFHNRNSPEYHNFPLLRNNYVGFNVRKEPFTDRRVRLAFSMAIDRKIFPKILRRQEQPSNTWIPPGMLGYAADSGPPFNPDQAKRLLAECGYPNGKNFPKISVLYPSREDARLVMEAIQDQLKRNLNISVDLMNQEWKVYLQTLRRDAPPMFRSSWGADYPDPETFCNIFTSYNGNNDTSFKNSTYDKLVSCAAGEQDQKIRADLYRKADHLLCSEEVPIACTYLSTQNIMVKPWVHGIGLNPLDLQFFKDVRIDPIK